MTDGPEPRGAGGMKRIWSDPVWSKVISVGFIALGTYVWTLLPSDPWIIGTLVGLVGLGAVMLALPNLRHRLAARARQHVSVAITLACAAVATLTWATVERSVIAPLKLSLEAKSREVDSVKQLLETRSREAKPVETKAADGPLSGTWWIRSFYIDDSKVPHQQVAKDYKVDLAHAGGQVFGTKHGTGKEWKFSGHVRQKFLTLTYGGVEGGLGTGAYALQNDIEHVYWGYSTAVECIGPDALYVRCPAVMYKQGYGAQLARYRDFLDGECEQLKSPQKCKVVGKP